MRFLLVALLCAISYAQTECVEASGCTLENCALHSFAIDLCPCTCQSVETTKAPPSPCQEASTCNLQICTAYAEHASLYCPCTCTNPSTASGAYDSPGPYDMQPSGESGETSSDYYSENVEPVYIDIDTGASDSTAETGSDAYTDSYSPDAGNAAAAQPTDTGLIPVEADTNADSTAPGSDFKGNGGGGDITTPTQNDGAPFMPGSKPAPPMPIGMGGSSNGDGPMGGPTGMPPMASGSGMPPMGFMGCELLTPMQCHGPAADPGRFCMWHSRDMKCQSGDPNSPEDFCAQLDNMGDCNGHQHFGCCWDRGGYCDKFDASDCGLMGPGQFPFGGGMMGGNSMSGGVGGLPSSEMHAAYADGMEDMREDMFKNMMGPMGGSPMGGGMGEQPEGFQGGFFPAMFAQMMGGNTMSSPGAKRKSFKLEKMATITTKPKHQHSNQPIYVLACLVGILVAAMLFVIYNNFSRRKKNTTGLLANAV